VTERLWTVPVGTTAERCRGTGCDAVLYFVKTKNSRMPIDCNGPEGVSPTAASPGQGIPHFAVCPDADRFRSKRGAA
jgi:hypothetical protein